MESQESVESADEGAEESSDHNDATSPSRKRPRLDPNDDDPNHPLLISWSDFDSTPWGHIPMIRYLSVPEIDSLIGWAHHVDRPNQHNGSSSSSSHDNYCKSLATDSAPPSLLRLLDDTAREMNNDDDTLWESLDTSALVSLGMWLEEIMTQQFLPLALRYVDHCSCHESTTECCQDILLPPEEATLKQLASKAQRHSIQVDDETERQQIKEWCQSRQLDETLILDNWDVLHDVVRSFCTASSK